MQSFFQFIIITFLLSSSIAMQGQTTYTISGVVRDANSGELLAGANVYLVDNTSIVMHTNANGFYSLTIPIDTIQLAASFIGYQTATQKLKLTKDTLINIELTVGNSIKEIVVNASSNQAKINSTEMGVEEVTAKEAKQIVTILGEADIIKVLQLKPGVQSGIEGSSGVHVRGGKADQNHFILDEATIYNPTHLLGLFSTFNADAVRKVKLYKAGFPAQFGGKLSAVLDISMREGNRKKIQLAGGIGLLSARLLVEGPIVKNKGAFLLAARKTYVDGITSIINQQNANNENWSNIPGVSFYDINAKWNYDISPKDCLFFSAYLGRDNLAYKTSKIDFDLNWGNIAATLRWNRTISAQMIANTSLTFSDYQYEIGTYVADLYWKVGSGIRDVNLKTDLIWQPSRQHTLKFGGNATYHRFAVGQVKSKTGTGTDLEAGNIFHAGEFGAYISEDWTISSKLKIRGGLRLSGFYNQQKFHLGVEPRFAIKYSIHANISLKASYARMSQYLHLVTTSGATLPTDVWYPSTPNVAPQYSDLVAASISFALGKDLYINIEGYYKWLHNQVDFKDGARLFVNENLDEEFIFGRGYSYGGEIYIEKKHGDIRGWIGYTLSWTWNQFEEANGGEPYHPKHDRRHDISAVIMWDIPWTKPKFPLTFSASWIYGTGAAVSVPTKRYILTDITNPNPFQFIPIYSKRGSYLMPAYHRLDLSLTCKLFPLSKQRFKSELTFSIYNVYDRRNPYFMYIDQLYEDGSRGANSAQIPEKFQAKIVSLFPIIPSITWNFKW